MADRRLCSFLFPFVLGFGFRVRINNRESQVDSICPDHDEGSFASAHGALLMHPETLAQSPLQHLAGTVLGQIRF
jgi:hypothetical protein